MSRNKRNWDRLVKGDGNYYGDTRPGPVPPPKPLRGDMWINDADLVMHVWNGSAWVPVYGGGGSVPGQKGQKGTAGTKGIKGDDGLQGEKGNKGQIGPAADKGDTGATGQKGQQGDRGLKGTAGAKGAQGEKGLTGLTGTKGPKGDQGVQGIKGEASRLLTFRGEVANEAALDTPATDPKAEGDVWKAQDTGFYYVYDGTDWVEIGTLDAAKGEKGQKGQTGVQGIKGTAGIKGNTGSQGQKGQQGQKGEDADKGQKGQTGAKGIEGEKGVQGDSIKGQKGQEGQSIKGEPGQDGVFPEPNNDDILYGRSTTKGDPGAGIDPSSSWRRAVEWAGDEMAGDLSSPALTTGPDTDDKSILYMNTGADSYNGGPHELEAREAAATDWDAWFLYPAAEENNWSDVAYGNGKFVAVSKTGTSRVMTSSDGKSWTSQSAPEASWTAVTFGNGLFVAVADNGTNRLMTSTDGVTWTSQSVQSSGWYDVTYSGSRFVAVAINGTNRVMYSDDGVNWTARSTPGGNMAWSSVAYGDGKFVAVAEFGFNNRVMVSPDGENWTIKTPSSNKAWNSITYGNGLFVAVAYGSGSQNVMTSPDGETWTGRTTSVSASLFSVSYGGGRFAAFGHGQDYVLTSTNGESWETHSVPETNSWEGSTYANEKFVAVSYIGNNRVLVLDTSSAPAGLYFDDELLITSSSSEAIRDKVNLLANAVVNNAESIAAIAPNVFRGTWNNTGATPSSGQYKVEPVGNDFASVTKLIISRIDSNGVDHTGNDGQDGNAITEFYDVGVGDTISVLNTENPYGLTAKVSSVVYDGTGNLEVDLVDVSAVDDPDGGISISGSAVIKVQKTVVTQGGPVVIWNGDSLPTITPNGGEIVTGTLFFNNTSLLLYIWTGGAWLQITS